MGIVIEAKARLTEMIALPKGGLSLFDKGRDMERLQKRQI
jgi:hypothetical protein